MDALELHDLIQKWETSTVQFKETVLKKKWKESTYDLATEMVAFSNSKGGLLIIGVVDKTGEIKGLSIKELDQANGRLANAASDNVKPPIFIFTETVQINNQNVLIAHIPEGTSKPHMDNKGGIWLKNGSDKRKVTSREEMARLLQSAGNLFADETMVQGTSINDIDIDFFKQFVKKKYEDSIDNLGLSTSQLLSNMAMLENGKLSLGALLLFAKNPQRFRPLFTIHCMAIKGNSLSGDSYRNEKEPFTGNIQVVYEKAHSFIVQNLKKIQKGNNFNSSGELEIPIEVIEELLVNALVHRDYFINSNIKVFIFDDRIEIISPGKLPNTLTVNNLKAGVSLARNPILYSNSRYLLPFKGAGSGIMRVFKKYPDIKLINDTERELFLSVIKRKNK